MVVRPDARRRRRLLPARRDGHVRACARGNVQTRTVGSIGHAVTERGPAQAARPVVSRSHSPAAAGRGLPRRPRPVRSGGTSYVARTGGRRLTAGGALVTAVEADARSWPRRGNASRRRRGSSRRSTRSRSSSGAAASTSSSPTTRSGGSATSTSGRTGSRRRCGRAAYLLPARRPSAASRRRPAPALAERLRGRADRRLRRHGSRARRARGAARGGADAAAPAGAASRTSC